MYECKQDMRGFGFPGSPDIWRAAESAVLPTNVRTVPFATDDVISTTSGDREFAKIPA